MPESFYGKTTNIEQWIADTLAALTYDGKAAFKKAEVWNFQIAATRGGFEAFDRYAPFAFVAFDSVDGHREGDHDLRQAMVFRVAIGFTSKEDGVARIGDANNLGCDKARDLVIAALDGKHPGVGFDCDDLFYDGEVILVEAPKIYAIQMHFKVNLMTV
jgi:hypothetical protein